MKDPKTENVKKGSRKFSQIADDRLVKRPQSAYNLFFKARATSGDMGGIRVPEMARLIADEFKALSVGEKKVCLPCPDCRCLCLVLTISGSRTSSKLRPPGSTTCTSTAVSMDTCPQQSMAAMVPSSQPPLSHS